MENFKNRQIICLENFKNGRIICLENFKNRQIICLENFKSMSLQIENQDVINEKPALFIYFFKKFENLMDFAISYRVFP